MRLESATVELRDRLDDYCAARQHAGYCAHAGLDLPPREALEEAFGAFTSGDVLDALRRERDAAPPGSRTRADLGRLLLLAEDAYLDAATEPLGRAARSPDRSHEVRGAQLEERFLARAELRERLGYATGLERARARLAGVVFERYVHEAARYLDATDVIYGEVLREIAPRLGIDPGRAHQDDLARIDHLGGVFDDLFVGGLAVQCLEATLAPMQLELDRVKGLRIDDEPREGRRPGVIRFAIRCPGDVVVSAGARAGASAYAATFHAAGRALAAAFAAEALPVERRRPYDRGLDAAWGALLSDRFADPIWLATFPAGRHGDALARAFHFRELFARRRAAGQALFAWELAQLAAGSDPRRLADHWAEGARRATGLAHTPPRYLEGQDAELGALDPLRGRWLAHALANHLRERFGWTFWRERRAGVLLKELWNTGSSYTVEELAAELGLGEPSLEPWIDAAARGA